jgi:hypothetical protein
MGATTMALCNRDRVGWDLETLRAGLALFVERELKTRLRGDWRTEVERGSRYEQAEFAADLAQVYRGESEYRDPASSSTGSTATGRAWSASREHEAS